MLQAKLNLTIVKVEESLQGLLPTLFRHYFQQNLDKGMLKNLKESQVAAETKVHWE